MSNPPSPPSTAHPVAQPTGLISREWFAWLKAIAAEAWIGGGNGNGGAKVAVGMPYSPTAFTAPGPGTAFIAGGTVSAVSVTRNGTAVPTGMTGGAVPLSAGDVLTVTWSAAPVVNFVPR